MIVTKYDTSDVLAVHSLGFNVTYKSQGRCQGKRNTRQIALFNSLDTISLAILNPQSVRGRSVGLADAVGTSLHSQW